MRTVRLTTLRVVLVFGRNNMKALRSLLVVLLLALLGAVLLAHDRTQAGVAGLPTCYRLTINISGQGDAGLRPGAPTSSPGCGPLEYTVAATVLLTSIESVSGWDFEGWSAPAGSFSCASCLGDVTYTMPAQAVTVTAHFQDEPTCYRLTINISGQGDAGLRPGAPTSSPGCGPLEYTVAATVLLTSIESVSGWDFEGWSAPAGSFSCASCLGDVTYTMPAQAVTVTAHFQVVASFTLEPPWDVGENSGNCIEHEEDLGSAHCFTSANSEMGRADVEVESGIFGGASAIATLGHSKGWSPPLTGEYEVTLYYDYSGVAKGHSERSCINLPIPIPNCIPLISYTSVWADLTFDISAPQGTVGRATERLYDCGVSTVHPGLCNRLVTDEIIGQNRSLAGAGPALPAAPVYREAEALSRRHPRAPAE